MGKQGRYTKAKGNGGVLDSIPAGSDIKTGEVWLDGVCYYELLDGRFVRRPPSTSAWSIRGGQKVQGPFPVGVVR